MAPIDAGARYLVLSDMHFGTPESSINTSTFSDGLVNYIVDSAPWEKIILTGDLLDVNLATFTKAIEGGAWPDLKKPLLGFRGFLKALDERAQQRTGKGLPSVAKGWVYTPGNHDYKVLDLLATTAGFVAVLTAGGNLRSANLPLQSCRWSGLESFFAGIFVSFGAQGQVVVEYPDHQLDFAVQTAEGEKQESMVLTHGHYLDPSQTRGNDLSACLSGVAAGPDLASAVRTFFVKTAQYQALANAVSYTPSTIHLVNSIVGPGSWGSKLDNFVHWLKGLPLRLLYGGERRRGEPISDGQLQNIDAYLTLFRGYAHVPRWFVFGHTHRQAMGKTKGLGVEVYNAGSCYPENGKQITFAQIDTATNGTPIVQLRWIDDAGQVKPCQPPGNL
jgi:UDP-2,3-diacylglucosamine pyrophosphatase LpxH